MMDDVNKQLPVIDILKSTYSCLFNNIKAFLILSYSVMAPIYAVNYFLAIDINQQQEFSAQIIFYSLFILLIMLILSIFLYRLFMLGANHHLKLSMAEMTNIFSKTFIYSLALFFVIFLTILCIALLFGLMVSIINATAGDGALNKEIIGTIIKAIIMGFALIVVLRTQPTFISIALKDEMIPMKSAYYYTRDNNVRLLIIGLLSYMPIMALSATAIMLDHSLSENLDRFLSFVISPLNLMPYALLLSAGAQTYKYFLTASKEYSDIK